MERQHEPFPLLVMNRGYDVLRANQAAARLFLEIVPDPAALQPPRNIFRMLFDPALGRTYVVDWERIARRLLSRLHRESLMRPLLRLRVRTPCARRCRARRRGAAGSDRRRSVRSVSLAGDARGHDAGSVTLSNQPDIGQQPSGGFAVTSSSPGCPEAMRGTFTMTVEPVAQP